MKLETVINELEKSTLTKVSSDGIDGLLINDGADETSKIHGWPRMRLGIVSLAVKDPSTRKGVEFSASELDRNSVFESLRFAADNKKACTLRLREFNLCKPPPKLTPWQKQKLLREIATSMFDDS